VAHMEAGGKLRCGLEWTISSVSRTCSISALHLQFLKICLLLEVATSGNQYDTGDHRSPRMNDKAKVLSHTQQEAVKACQIVSVGSVP